MTTLTPPRPSYAAAAPAPAARDHRPVLLAWAGLLLVLGIGLPLFLRMPLTYDTVQYDLCARTVLRGGAMYRDAADNNMPGVIWIQAAARAMVGWRSESLRLVDFALISVTIQLLLALVAGARRGRLPRRRDRGSFRRFLPVFGRTYSLSARLLDAASGGRGPFSSAPSTPGRRWGVPVQGALHAGRPGRVALGRRRLDQALRTCARGRWLVGRQSLGEA